MKSRIIQLIVSLILIVSSIGIIFMFVFNSGRLIHAAFWRILLLFFAALLVLNIRPHWSVEKKHRRFFEDFDAKADMQTKKRIFGTFAVSSSAMRILPTSTTGKPGSKTGKSS